MNEADSLVSIIIPTYNRAELIEETLHSVKNQTYPNWECIVVDDGSTDNTRDIIQSFCQLDIRFISIVNQRKKGACGSRNTGLNYARGNFVMFLDSDDLLAEYCLTRRMSVVKSNNNFELFCFQTGVILNTPFDTPYCWNYLHKKQPDITRFLMQDMPWCTNSVLWKKSSILQLNGWNEDILSWQDWELHVRMLLQKNITYYKVNDEKKFIDNFYRRFSSKDSISSNEGMKDYFLNRMYFLKKIKPLIKDYQNENLNINIEYVRLIYRITGISMRYINIKDAWKFFYSSTKGLGFSFLFIFLWFQHLRNNAYPYKYKIIRKALTSIPKVYPNKSLSKTETTHLKAELKK